MDIESTIARITAEDHEVPFHCKVERTQRMFGISQSAAQNFVGTGSESRLSILNAYESWRASVGMPASGSVEAVSYLERLINQNA